MQWLWRPCKPQGPICLFAGKPDNPKSPMTNLKIGLPIFLLADRFTWLSFSLYSTYSKRLYHNPVNGLIQDFSHSLIRNTSFTNQHFGSSCKSDSNIQCLIFQLSASILSVIHSVSIFYNPNNKFNGGYKC